MYKKYLYALILSIAFSLSVANIAVSQVLAEVEQNSVLIVTTYETTKDFDTLLENSKRVLAYYSGKEVDKPVMLHVVTKEQQKVVFEKKYESKIVKENPDMQQYRLFYLIDPQEVEKLKQLGEVTQLSKRYALVMVGDGKTIAAQTSTLKVMPAPFLDLVVSTNKKTKVYASPPVESGPAKPSDTILLVAGVFALLILLAGTGYFFYRKRKQKSSDDPNSVYVELPQSPPDQPVQ